MGKSQSREVINDSNNNTYNDSTMLDFIKLRNGDNGLVNANATNVSVGATAAFSGQKERQSILHPNANVSGSNGRYHILDVRTSSVSRSTKNTSLITRWVAKKLYHSYISCIIFYACGYAL